MRNCRQQMQLEANYASQQQQAGHAPDAGVRMIVVSWMVEVAEEFRLQQETLHMAVLLLDRFMGNSEVRMPQSCWVSAAWLISAATCWWLTRTA